ncbi:polysaccharide biosynthesis tyrosine autokinase [Flavihumibacter profundi]|uniref:polysaccharide biosynthesis tyrosine autokinase n=1 Tax=Flavihumibacter profundi TaxID=2716883 RepID=UPI001CC356F1|nr:tyrosine-protein kinase domain-containing protein [Flavihumibacter profundi]MBZ5855765.1 AAA family ATPase [Flavihumibacter profundi]
MINDRKKNTPHRKNDEFIKPFIQKYLPYWPLLLLLGIVCLSLAYVYAQWAEKSYEVKARILINDQQKGIDESKMLESLDVFKGSTIVENEIEILQSRTLIRKVVKNLYLYAPIFQTINSRKVSAFRTAPFRIQVSTPENIKEAQNITAVYEDNSRTVTIKNKNYPLNQVVKTPWGEMSFLSNPDFEAGKGSNVYSFSLIDIRKVEEGLSKSLKVSPVNRLTSVVDITLNDSDPGRGKEIVNELIRLYILAEVEQKNVLARNVVASVENRLQYVSGQLDSVENAIERYRSSEGITDISIQGKLYLENVGQYDRQIQDVNIKLAVLDEVEKFVNSKQAASGVIPSVMGVDDPGLSQLLEKLSEAQFQYAKLKKTTGENSPILSSLSEQIAALKPSISEMINNQRTSLSISKARLENTGSRYTSMLSTIPHKEKQLLEIGRQQSIKNQIYSYLLERREEAALSLAATKPDSRVIDLAEASVKPVTPKKLFIYIGSLMVAGLLGLMFVEVKEGMGKHVKFRKEIEDAIDLEIIGEIFQDRKATPVVFNSKSKSKVAEQIRSIRNQLFYTGTSERSKILFISSFVKKDGKAFLALNLASSMAIAGKKTLLVDLDASQLNITRHFSLEDKPGFSDYINKVKPAADAIYNSSEQENLYVMPAGTTTGNIEAWPDEQYLESLFTYLRNTYDCIIFCAGPLGQNANARRVANYCDKSILVIRHNVTPKSALLAFAKRPSDSGLTSPVIVFNGIRARGFAGRGYGDGLGYGYDLKY